MTIQKKMFVDLNATICFNYIEYKTTITMYKMKHHMVATDQPVCDFVHAHTSRVGDKRFTIVTIVHA